MSIETCIICILFSTAIVVSQYRFFIRPALDEHARQLKDIYEQIKEKEAPAHKVVMLHERHSRLAKPEKTSEQLTQEAISKSIVTDKKRMSLEEINEELHKLA
jgi:hypothetical protein